jgi:hypothetical protein
MLNDTTYKLIASKRYSLASIILDFGLNTMKKHGSERSRKVMVVNFANCKKLMGHREKSDEVLEKEDWTAADIDFQVCVAAVKGDADKVVSLINRAHKAGMLSADDFKDWPVFEEVRKDKRFIAEFERVFNMSYFTDKEVKAPLAEIADQEIPVQPALSEDVA